MIFAIGLVMWFLAWGSAIVFAVTRAEAPEWVQLVGGAAMILGPSLMVLSLAIKVWTHLP